MSSLRRTLKLAAAVSLAIAAGAPLAHAARVPHLAMSPDGTAHVGWVEKALVERAWTPAGALTDAQYLSNPYAQITGADVATDAAGASYHVWVNGRVEARRRGPDGSLGPTLTLSPANAFSVDVAADPQGNAVFVWFRQLGADQYVQARRLSSSGALGPILTLSAAGLQSRRPAVAMDASGNAVVVWDRHSTSGTPGEENYYVVQARRIKPDGTLGVTQEIAAASHIESPQVAMDGSGNALIGWIHTNNDIVSGTTSFPQVRRRSASGALGGVQDVAPATTVDARDIRLAMSPSGSAMIVWARFVSGYQEVQARFRGSGGGFGSVLTLSSTADTKDSGNAAVAMDADGNALVAWERHSPGSGDPAAAAAIQARRRSSAGAVGPLETVTARVGIEQTNPALAIAPGGDAAIAWEAHGGDYNRAILGRRRQADGAYGAVKQVDGP